MATPVVTHDFTTFDACNSVSAFSGWGVNSSKWYTDTEIYLEGTGAVALAPSSTGDGGQGVSGTSFNANTNLIAVWIKIIDSSWASAIASHGIYIRITSAANWTDFYDYDVGGSDVAWSSGGWHLVVLDATRTPDRTGGTAPTMTAITRVGVGVNIQYTSSKGNVFWIDAIRHGTYYEVVGDMHTDGTNGITFNDNGASADTVVRLDGGSWITDGYENGDWIRIRNAGAGIDGDYQIQSAPTASTLTLSIGDFSTSSTADTDAEVYLGITLEDIYQYDIGTSTYFYGVVTKNTLGTYEINFPLTIGDISGAGNTWFRTVGEVITFTDQPIKPATSDLYLVTAEDTGKTHFTIGQSDGTGDDRVGYNGSLFTQDNAQWSGDSYLDLNQAIDEQEIFNLTALRLTGGCDFAADTSHLITSCTFSGCGQVTLGSGEARGLTFAGYTGASGAALLWNASIDIKNSQFLANTRAIEHTTEGDFGYVGLTFAGNTYDVVNANNATSVQSYPNTNQDTEIGIGNGTTDAIAHSFQNATAGQLVKGMFHIRKVGTPTGNAYLQLYTHSGTFGTSSVPTGAVLKQSLALDVSTLSTSLADIEVFFEASEFYDLLGASQAYCLVLDCSGISGDGSNYVSVGYDNSSPTGSGNGATLPNGGSWTAQSYDFIHEVWRDGEAQINASSGANPSTKEKTGSPTSAIAIINTVSLKVTVKDEDGVVIQNAQTGIYALETAGGVSKGDELIDGDGGADTDVNGVVENTGFNYSGNVDVEVRSRKSSSGDSPRYKHLVSPQQIQAAGLNVIVTLIEDPINS